MGRFEPDRSWEGGGAVGEALLHAERSNVAVDWHWRREVSTRRRSSD
jgi:hypothetical protein